MNVKVLAVGDPHCKISNIQEIRELSDKLCDLIDREKPDFCVVLGDLSDTFETVKTLALNEASSLLIKLANKINTIYVVGNHDYINNTQFLTSDHVFAGLNHDRLKIVDKATTLDFNDLRFVFVPHVPPGRLQEAIQTLGPNHAECHAVFCHQEFIGAKMGMIDSKHGDHWPSAFPLAVSGHIHEYGRLRPNILYVGAPMMHTFADDPNKTVSMLTFDLSGWDEVRIDLDMPKKIVMDVKVEDIKEIKVLPGSKTKINLHGSSEALQAIKKTKEYAALVLVAKIVPIRTESDSAPLRLRKSSYLEILTGFVKKEGGEVESQFSEVQRHAFSLK